MLDPVNLAAFLGFAAAFSEGKSGKVCWVFFLISGSKVDFGGICLVFLPGGEGEAGRGGHEQLGVEQWRRLRVAQAQGATPSLKRDKRDEKRG